jgi:hypothetical protein
VGSTPWGALAIIGTCWLADGIVGRRAPKVVRREETICRTHDRAVHRVPGLSPGETAAVTEVEHGSWSLVMLAVRCAARRRWRAGDGCTARDRIRAVSRSAGGPGSRGVLEQAISCLPRRAKPGLRRVVRQVDQVYLRQTLPDPLAEPGSPWWERRRPAGWPRPARS